MNALKREPMKTVSARIPTEDEELFQLICEEYRLTQSEVIRSLIQFLVSKTFETPTSPTKLLLQLNDFQASNPSTTPVSSSFYENFKLINRLEQANPTLKVGNL